MLKSGYVILVIFIIIVLSGFEIASIDNAGNTPPRKMIFSLRDSTKGYSFSPEGDSIWSSYTLRFYNDNYQLDSINSFDLLDGAWTKTYAYRYQFHADNVLKTRDVLSQFDKSLGTLSRRDISEYNANGQQIKGEGFRWNGKTWDLTNQNLYDDEGRSIFVTDRGYNNGEIIWENLNYYWYYADSTNQKVIRNDILNNTSDSTRLTYHFDERKNVVSETNYRFENSKWVPDSYNFYDYVYDGNENVVQKTESSQTFNTYLNLWNDIVPYRRIIYTYNSEGMKTIEKQYVGLTNPDGEVLNRTDSIIYENENIVFQGELNYRNGEFYSFYYSIYEFDNNGNQTLYERYRESPKDVITGSWKYVSDYTHEGDFIRENYFVWNNDQSGWEKANTYYQYYKVLLQDTVQSFTCIQTQNYFDTLKLSQDTTLITYYSFLKQEIDTKFSFAKNGIELSEKDYTYNFWIDCSNNDTLAFNQDSYFSNSDRNIQVIIGKDACSETIECIEFLVQRETLKEINCDTSYVKIDTVLINNSIRIMTTQYEKPILESDINFDQGELSVFTVQNSKYSWLECNTSDTLAVGKTSFRPVVSGSYYCILQLESCFFETDCFDFKLEFDTTQIVSCDSSYILVDTTFSSNSTNISTTFYEKPSLESEVSFNQGELSVFDIENTKYSWLECNTSDTLAVGKASFRPVVSGSYYCILQLESCFFKTDCFEFQLEFDTTQIVSCDSSYILVDTTFFSNSTIISTTFYERPSLESKITFSDSGLSVPLKEGFNYSWFNCNSEETLEVGSSSFSPTKSGSYYCLVEYESCDFSTPCFEFSVLKTKEQEFKLFPNPFDDYLNIIAPESVYSFELLTMAGEVLIVEKSLNGNSSLDVKFLNSGIYILRVIQKNEIRTYKIVKK